MINNKNVKSNGNGSAKSSSNERDPKMSRNNSEKRTISKKNKPNTNLGPMQYPSAEVECKESPLAPKTGITKKFGVLGGLSGSGGSLSNQRFGMKLQNNNIPASVGKRKNSESSDDDSEGGD